MVNGAADESYAKLFEIYWNYSDAGTAERFNGNCGTLACGG